MSSELIWGCPKAKIGGLICEVKGLPVIAAVTEVACGVDDPLSCGSREVYPVPAPCDCSLSSLCMF